LVQDEQHIVVFAVSLSNDKGWIDAYHDREPLLYHTIDDISACHPSLDWRSTTSR
jgi:hypothetical protein